MWILIAILLPIICLFEPIFRLLQVEAEVAHIAGKYMQYSAFGVPVSSISVVIGQPFVGNRVLTTLSGLLHVWMHEEILPSSGSDGRSCGCCGPGCHPYVTTSFVRFVWAVSFSFFCTFLLQVSLLINGTICPTLTNNQIHTSNSTWILLEYNDIIFIYIHLFLLTKNNFSRFTKI